MWLFSKLTLKKTHSPAYWCISGPSTSWSFSRLAIGRSQLILQKLLTKPSRDLIQELIRTSHRANSSFEVWRRLMAKHGRRHIIRNISDSRNEKYSRWCDRSQECKSWKPSPDLSTSRIMVNSSSAKLVYAQEGISRSMGLISRKQISLCAYSQSSRRTTLDGISSSRLAQDLQDRH